MERLSDRLSDLPDSVLLHIMNFLNAQDAVQTCLLSKRWKDLWKSLTNLTLHSSDFRMLPLFSKFLTSILSHRDDSISLYNLDLWWRHYRIDTNLLIRVMTYAASHHVQQLTIKVSLSVKKDFQLPSSIFCRSLTFLKLSFRRPRNPRNPALHIKLPKSLELPALKSLHISNVAFATGDNGCAEPFSTCNMLDTLVIEHYCYLKSDVKVLCISNSKLFSLTIVNFFRSCEKAYEIILSTPNLNLLTIKGHLVHQISSTCNITCLEEVNIHNLYCVQDFLTNGLLLISCLRVLVNVKIMTVSRSTFDVLNALLSCGSIKTQFPCFVKLKTLKLDKKSFSNISEEEVRRVVDYLLQNSPFTRVDNIKFLTLEGF